MPAHGGVPAAALCVCRRRRAARRAERARDAEPVHRAAAPTRCSGRTFAAGGRRHRAPTASPSSAASFWERHFGGAPSVIGRTIQLDALPYTVVGVMAAELRFSAERQRRHLDAARFDPNDQHGRSRKARSLSVVGRLADGVARGAGAARDDASSPAASPRRIPDSNTGWGARVVAAQEQLVTTVRPALLLISGAVGFLLLIVCANVANLMLARLSSRRTRNRRARGARRGTLASWCGRCSRRASCCRSSAARSACSSRGRASASCTRCPKAACRACRTSGSTAACCCSRCSMSVGVALVFGLVPALQASRAGLRDTDARVLGHDAAVRLRAC